MGANACKGQSACKGGKSPGPGANACKGQGSASMDKDACKAAKGKFKPARSQAGLILVGRVSTNSAAPPTG